MIGDPPNQGSGGKPASAGNCEIVRLDFWRRLEAAESSIADVNATLLSYERRLRILRTIGRVGRLQTFVAGIVAGAAVPALVLALYSLWGRH